MSNSFTSDDENLENVFCFSNVHKEFVEKLYEHNNLVSPILFEIKRLTKNFTSNAQRITELYYQLLEKLLQIHKNEFKEINNIKAIKASTRKELYKRLHYAKDYIDSCYASQITLHELSLVALMNTSYFLRQYKKYFRITPYQYLMQRRLHKAAEMLDNTRLPVAEICAAVGYEDVSSFAKLFKKQFSFSPEVYRKRVL